MKPYCNFQNFFPRSELGSNFVCVLANHLDDKGMLGARKCKLLKTGFKVQVFENDTNIVFV